MIKINFKNGASGKTPLNAANLNKMQDNIEDATMISRISLQGNSIQEGTPSIDNEVPIKSVGDSINLFDGKLETGYFDDTTGVKATDDNLKRNTNPVRVEPNQSYIFSNNGEGVGMTVFQYTSNMVFVKKTTVTANNSFITENTTAYVNFYRGNTNIDKIQLEKGTEITSYIPYGQGSIEIYSCNENLYDYINNPFSGKPISAEGIEGESNSTWKSTINYIKVINSTAITISGYGKVSWKFYFAEYDKNYNFIQRTEFMMSDYSIGYTFTTTESTTFIKLYGPITQITPSKIMVNIGGITNYVEHQSQTKTLYTQQPFRAIGDVKDRFVKQNGVWYEEHNIARINSYNSETITTEYMSSTGELSVGAVVDYILTKPTLIECTTKQVKTLSDIYGTYTSGLINITCTDEVEPVIEITKVTKGIVQSENEQIIATLLTRIEELEKKIQQ